MRELLEAAGFAEVRVEAIDLQRHHDDFAELWDSTLDLSHSFHDAVFARPESEIAEVHASLAKRFEPYTAWNGTLEIPGRTLVASASA